MKFLFSYDYFSKCSFLFPGFLILKTTFSYFLGKSENPVPAMKASCKGNNNLKAKKIVDDYRF